MNKMDKLKKFLNVKYLTLIALIVLILINVAQMLSKSNIVDEKNTTEKSTKQKQTTKKDYGGINGTGIYSTLKDQPDIDVTPVILEVLKDNTIKPDEKKGISMKKCTEYIQEYIKKHPKLITQYDKNITKTLCSASYTLTEADFRVGLIK